MKTFIVTSLAFLISAPAFANVCTSRAQARNHTRISQARLEFQNRKASCQTLPAPDRVVQCINAARGTFEQKSQSSREQLARDLRACASET